MLEEIVSDEDIFVIAALFGTGVVAILVFGCGWVVVSLAKILSNARLKRLMIDRGMAAEEIARVVQAGSEESPQTLDEPKIPPVRKPKANWNA